MRKTRPWSPPEHPGAQRLRRGFFRRIFNEFLHRSLRGPSPATPSPGVYFRLQLGGITGHKDFARDSGVLLTPEECVPVAAAVVRVFIEHGDRTDRKKARLKYLLDRWGVDKYVAETEKALGRPLRKFPLEKCVKPAGATDKLAHIGVHPQKQEGLFYVGVLLPGRPDDRRAMRGLASIAERYGSGGLRLTVWQNVLIPDVPAERVDDVKREVEKLGLATSATGVRGGLGRLHRQRRVQVRDGQHQGTRFANRRPSRSAGNASTAPSTST